MPILMLGYFVGYLDRTNISFAADGLREEFGMGAGAFGFAVGIFFAGYVLFEIPSNRFLHKLGARIWISRIMLTWGVVTVLLGFVTGPTGLYVLRFLLGVAEAGFFPGIILYLSLWFPNAVRARMLSIFMLSVSIALALGALLNGQILTRLDGVLGLDGWRWIFIVGGVLAVILGIVSFVMLTDSPAKARWLDDDERAWLVETLEAERVEREAGKPAVGFWAGLKDRRTLFLALIFFLISFGNYPLAFWLPQLVRSLGPDLTTVQLSLITAVPYALAAVVLSLMAWRFARREGQVAHVVVPLTIAVGALAVVAATLQQPVVALVAITVAVMTVLPATAMFWSLPTHYLTGAAAASGIALINSVGNIAGFAAPYGYGLLLDWTSSAGMSVGMLGLAVATAAVLLVTWRARRRTELVEPSSRLS